MGASVTSSSELRQFSNIFKPRILKVRPCKVFSLQYIMCHLTDNYSTALSILQQEIGFSIVNQL